MNSSHRQSGFSVVYVIIGVLLTAAVVGGIMMAQLRGRTVPTGSTIATNQGQNKEGNSNNSANGQSQSTTDNEKRKAAEKADTEKKAAEEKAAADKQAAEKKAADEKAAASAKQQTAQPTPSTTTQSGNAASGGSSAGSGPMARTATGSQMPTTGPTEDALGSAFGLIALVGAGYVYYTYGRRTA